MTERTQYTAYLWILLKEHHGIDEKTCIETHIEANTHTNLQGTWSGHLVHIKVSMHYDI